jgi:hypothetical protein
MDELFYARIEKHKVIVESALHLDEWLIMNKS